MGETSTEEFFEASNYSEHEYYDAESQNFNDVAHKDWFEEIQYGNTFKQYYSHVNENLSTGIQRDEISSLIDPTELRSENTPGKKIENNNQNNEAKDERMEGSSEILEAILNEESLKKIYFGEKCISNDIVGLDGDLGTENKINLWSYINNNDKKLVKQAPDKHDQFSGKDTKNYTIDKEVEELELEIEKMFNARSTEKLGTEPISPYGKNCSKKSLKQKSNCAISNKKISPLPPSAVRTLETGSNITQILSGSKGKNICNFDEIIEYEKYRNKNIQGSGKRSSVSVFQLSQEVVSQLSQSETETSEQSKEIVTLMKKDSAKALPVHSIELTPKLLEKEENRLKKIDIEKHIRKNYVHPENIICVVDQPETCTICKKHKKPKISKEFKKVQSFIVSSKGNKRGSRNSSKSFHSEISKVSSADQSISYLSFKGTGKMQASERKLKRMDSKKMKYEKQEYYETETKNIAINTNRIKRMNFSCQKIGAFIDSTNFCSISLTLESAFSNATKKELMNSLKEQFWLTQSSKERALLQFVILCMADNFQEISINNEKFKLYCQNEFSSCSSPKSTMQVANSKKNRGSDLICQPLFIETITSQSQVNRLGLELNLLSKHELRNTVRRSKMKRAKVLHDENDDSNENKIEI